MHCLVVHVDIKHLPLVNVRQDVSVIDVVCHAALPCRKLLDHIPMLEGGIAETIQGPLGDSPSIFSFHV